MFDFPSSTKEQFFDIFKVIGAKGVDLLEVFFF